MPEISEIQDPEPEPEEAPRDPVIEWMENNLKRISSFDLNEDGELDESEIETEYALGLTYKLNKLFHTGIEFKGSEYGHYFGPTISHGSHAIWFSLGSAFNLGTVKEGKPEMEIRMIIGVGL